MKTIEVTKLEKQVLEALASGMYAECGYSDVGIEEIEEWTGLNRNTIRGVAGSLEKKNLIYIDNRVDEGYKYNSNMHIWYLTELTQGLVEEWVEQEDWLTKYKVEKVILKEKQ